MPRTARDQSATGIYHVMIRGINRQDIFEAPEDYRKFIETLASLREVVSEDMQTKICTCHIYAYCIMPNHVHILIHEKGWTISQCVKYIADIYMCAITTKSMDALDICCKTDSRVNRATTPTTLSS